METNTHHIAHVGAGDDFADAGECDFVVAVSCLFDLVDIIVGGHQDIGRVILINQVEESIIQRLHVDVVKQRRILEVIISSLRGV